MIKETSRPLAVTSGKVAAAVSGREFVENHRQTGSSTKPRSYRNDEMSCLGENGRDTYTLCKLLHIHRSTDSEYSQVPFLGDSALFDDKGMCTKCHPMTVTSFYAHLGGMGSSQTGP